MFFTAEQISASIAELKKVHPFHGITFLACKKAQLPIGRTIEFHLDAKTDEFLHRYHLIDPSSNWFFQPFKSSVKTKMWVRPDYSAKGLQAINTQTFVDAFIHERKSRIWGWTRNYVSVLASRLGKKPNIPAFHLAVWLFREKDWPRDTTATEVIQFFLSEFNISNEEKEELFDLALPTDLLALILQNKKPSWSDLRQFLSAAPDSRPDQGGTLAYLETRGIGPAKKLVLEPANRLTIITGDNGLGKTFLLETAWWALTGLWAGRPAFPLARKKEKVSITFGIEGEYSRQERKSIEFNWKTLSWPQTKNRPTIPGLLVYGRVDGSFAVWDPAKQHQGFNDQAITKKSVFTSNEVWDGLPGQIEGLIRDWTRWQSNPSKYPFEIFTKVLAHLSPPDLGELRPGEPVRIPEDPRDIPTINHPYGKTPIVYSSAGVRRIITLTYLIVWAWNEHRLSAELAHTDPQQRLVILIDEMEAHLHPRWQRAVLPALIEIGKILGERIEVQFIVATHSPLVMASAEPIFNDDIDSLVHLSLSDSGEVTLNEEDFVAFGDISSWLTSPIFELRHARSKEAEAAIEDAKNLQLAMDVSQENVRMVSDRLFKFLSTDDKFWPRWISFAEKFGIRL
jgi:hypothetical protein